MSFAGPTIMLVIAAGTVGFEALVYGTETFESSIAEPIDNPACSESVADDSKWGPIATIACWVRWLGVGLANIFITIFGVIHFFWNAVTFNVPGAPAIVRVMVGTIFVGSVAWPIVSLLRGSSA